jgi:hypothetical protein
MCFQCMIDRGVYDAFEPCREHNSMADWGHLYKVDVRTTNTCNLLRKLVTGAVKRQDKRKCAMGEE